MLEEPKWGYKREQGKNIDDLLRECQELSAKDWEHSQLHFSAIALAKPLSSRGTAHKGEVREVSEAFEPEAFEPASVCFWSLDMSSKATKQD